MAQLLKESVNGMGFEGTARGVLLVQRLVCLPP